MEYKKILVALLVAGMFVLSGCAVKDYLNRYVVTEDANYNLLSEKDKYLNETAEISDETEDISEDISEIDEEDLEAGEEPQIKITVEENDTVTLKPEAKDADEDTIEYTFSSPLDEEGAWKTEFGDAGKYLVTVTASDGELTTSKEVLIEVLRKNVAPVIEGIPEELTIEEGDVIKVNPNVTDPNKDEFTVEISDPIGEDGIWNTTYQDHGEYLVTVTASDGELTSKKEMQLIVERKNIAPIIEAIDDITIDEGEAVSIEPEVSDLNGDKVTVTISEPVGDSGEWETSYTDHGEYDIKVTASDGELESVVNVKLTVNDINVAPEIIDITNIG